MNIFTLSWNNFKAEFFKKSLNIILIAFGIAIINIILIVSHQLENRLESHSGKVDVVIGAKGSPMQLILSSIYHADFPTGNIKLEDAQSLGKHPYVKNAAPISLGDSYNGYRIVGTNDAFLEMYSLQLKEGRAFLDEFEVILGSEVSRKLKLSTGKQFFSSHGLTEGGEAHHSHPFEIVGIMENSGTVADNLILTSLESVWHVHGLEGEGASEKEITSLLIKYNSPLAIAVFPAIVNQVPNLQAASPALETARLFSLLSSGFEIVQAFGVLIIILAAFSVFMVLFTSLSERKTDIALIRSMGAGRKKVFAIMSLEGLVITFLGTLAGIAVSHLFLAASSSFLPAQQATSISGMAFFIDELWVFSLGILSGLVASFIPAIVAYRTDISSVLAKG